MKMGSAGLNNLFLLDQVKGHCGFSTVKIVGGFQNIMNILVDCRLTVYQQRRGSQILMLDHQFFVIGPLHEALWLDKTLRRKAFQGGQKQGHHMCEWPSLSPQSVPVKLQQQYFRHQRPIPMATQGKLFLSCWIISEVYLQGNSCNRMPTKGNVL